MTHLPLSALTLHLGLMPLPMTNSYNNTVSPKKLDKPRTTTRSPMVEEAIQELEKKLLQQDPLNGTVTPLLLSTATDTLYSCICTYGLSAREMWTRGISILAPNYLLMIMISSLCNTKNNWETILAVQKPKLPQEGQLTTARMCRWPGIPLHRSRCYFVTSNF